MIKNIIKFIFLIILFSTTLIAKHIDDFKNKKRITKQDADIVIIEDESNNSAILKKEDTEEADIIIEDNETLSTMPQIKQMSYLPYKISEYSGGKEYVYYPPLVYKSFEFTGKDGIVISKLDWNWKENGDLLHMPTYYYWDNNAGQFTSIEDDDGNITSIYLMTHDGRVIKVLNEVISDNIPYQNSCRGGFIFVEKKDGNYTMWIVNIYKKTYKKIPVDNAYNIFTLGDVPLIFKDNKLYDIDGNEWEVEWRDGTKNLVPQGDDYYGSVQTQFGAGILIDGVYYAPNTHDSSYRVRFDFKKKKAIVDIVKGDIGEMTSKIAFGYAKNYFKVAGEETPFNIYHYVFKKYNDFWITKMPLKYSEMKGTKDKWYAYTEYGDFFIDSDNMQIYYTYGFNKWIPLPADKNKLLTDMGFNMYRFWFNRKNDNIVGVLGKFNTKADDDGNLYLVAYGIIFKK